MRSSNRAGRRPWNRWPDAIAAMGDFLRAEIAAGRTYLPAGANVLRAFQQPFDEVTGPDRRPGPVPDAGARGGAVVLGRARGAAAAAAASINIFRELQHRPGAAAAVQRRPDAVDPAGRAAAQQGADHAPRASPAAHRGKGWEEVTEQAIRALAARGKPLVSILWGRDARNLRPLLGEPAVGGVRAPLPHVGRPRLLRLPPLQPGQRPAGRGRAASRWTGACRDRVPGAPGSSPSTPAAPGSASPSVRRRARPARPRGSPGSRCGPATEASTRSTSWSNWCPWCGR